MVEVLLNGKYGDAKVFTENIDDVTVGQVIGFLNQPFVEGAKVRIMPDCHAGKGSVIGTTMEVKDKLTPNVVGVDIGCGMLTVELATQDIDFAKLDEVIRTSVPSGQSARNTAHKYAKEIDFDNVIAPFNLNRASLSVGSLGGGNHFIEVNQSDDGRVFLVIHSGSRHLGVKVATYHQNVAIQSLTSNKDQIDSVIQRLKAEGRHKEIQSFLKTYKSDKPTIPNELAYLQGKQMEDYLNDLKIAQNYAKWSRRAMVQVILEGMGIKSLGELDTIHNYIDLDHMILRKGAISARAGEKVLIPINMRDGSILATGRGNSDWNHSAPHGAGRILSRSKAKELLSLDAFKDTMKDVYSTSVKQDTLDESPFAYKTMDEIIANTSDTLIVDDIIRPLYNFKASN